MISVEIRNFQSIDHLSIQVEGFTCLVGRSNIGKSALVRAVKSALTGAAGTSFVRHNSSCIRRLNGSKTCNCVSTVRISTEGFDLTWKKGDKVNRYEFNGQTYDRTEQGTPEFLLRPLLVNDFGTVDVARKGKLLQVADQFDNVFLLDQTGGTVADVLSDVACLDRINIAIRMIEKDRREANSNRKVYEKEISELSATVQSYQSLDEALPKALEAQEQYTRISSTETKISGLGYFIEKIEPLQSRISSLGEIAGYVVPTIDSLLGALRLSQWLGLHSAQVTEKVAAFKALSGVETVQLPSVTYQAQASNVNQLSQWESRVTQLQDPIRHANDLEALAVPSVDRISSNLQKALQLQAFNDRLDVLKVKHSKLSAMGALLEKEEAELLSELKDLGVCPTCTQPLEYGSVHA